MHAERTQRLIAQIQLRLYAVRVWQRLRWAVIAGGGLMLALLLAVRLLAWLPAPSLSYTGIVAPLLVVVSAFLLTRWPTREEGARALDAAAASKDLFLTSSALAESSGGFSAVLVERAEAKARELHPSQVLKFPWRAECRDLAAVAAVLALGFWLLPQMDPFGTQQRRKHIAQKQQQIEQTRAATLARAEQLRTDPARENDKAAKALAELEKTLREAKPAEREKNLQRLAEAQKQIGEAWREAAQRDQNDTMEQANQRFGQLDGKKSEQWLEELRKGNAEPIKQEMEAIRQEMAKLAAQSPSDATRAQQEQLAEKLDQLRQNLQQAKGGSNLQSALGRAMEQLKLAKNGELSQQALDAAQESMALSEQELDQLTQSMQQQQSLEEALKNIQMARQLASEDKLDGSKCSNCKSMSDYGAMYANQLGGDGSAPGPGMGEKGGIGAGGTAPQDESAKTAFRPEISPSQVGAGKTLLELKTQGVGPKGERPEQYAEAIGEVKRGVSEAIATERIPPGYHDAIQKYFDSMPAK